MSVTSVSEAHKPRPRQRSVLRLDLIETFIVIAEERCLARAAERLYVSPSGITRRLQALETEYGTALIDRRCKTLGLTPAGHALVPHAIAITAAAQAAAEAVHEAPDMRLVNPAPSEGLPGHVELARDPIHRHGGDPEIPHETAARPTTVRP